MQDALGWLNNAAVADGLLLHLAHGHPEVAQSAGFVRGYLAISTECDARKLGKLWRQFAQMSLPYRK